MQEFVLFLLIATLALLIIARNNEFSFKAWFATQRTRMFGPPVHVSHNKYSFDDAIKRFGKTPDVDPDTGQLTEEVWEYRLKNKY